MTNVIALFNQSGGVGKSTLTMNLGYSLAKKKKKVLLLDLDPQASLTTFMGIEPYDLDKTIYDAIVHEEELPIHHQIHNMDLVPSNINLCGAEIELVSALMRELRLKETIAPYVSKYDIILIDCPPSFISTSVS